MKISTALFFLCIGSKVVVAQPVSFWAQRFIDTVVIREPSVVEQVNITGSFGCDITMCDANGPWENGWGWSGGECTNRIYSLNASTMGMNEGLVRYTIFLSQEHRGCAVDNPVIYHLSAFAISDSFPKIRPLPASRSHPSGWSLTMSPDLPGTNWRDSVILEFQNPTGDTVRFYNLTVNSKNNGTCTLSVFDSATEITEYIALPFSTKHSFNFIFSSTNYQSFDTITLSARIHRSNRDSISRFTIPVAWVAPLAVEESHAESPNYFHPNPFSRQVYFGFHSSSNSNFCLDLFDVTGRVVRMLEHECTEGMNEFTIDAIDLPPGPYYYVARAGEWMRSGKLVKHEP